MITLLALQGLLALMIVHRESLTFDEDDHMFAGYMMWHTGDYGLNPEHPPLVKLLATVPVLGKPLWVPPLQGREFKTEAYLDGRDWLARNDGGSQRMVFRMRVAAELLALGLALMVFAATREWFGDVAGLVALVLVVFDLNVLAHSALVTTDVGVSLFFLASVYTFYRYAVAPTAGRLLLAAVALGLLLATKHSGILIAPMLLVLALWEVWHAPTAERGRVAARMAGGLAAMTVIGVLVLWSFYRFRYAARPAGLALSTSLAQYAAPLAAWQSGVVLLVARLHLLPESYLMGLVDVKRVAEFYPTFLLGRVYAHGVWWYFPVVILIKTTLGLLGLCGLAAFAMWTRRLGGARQLMYVLVPAVVYLLVAMASGMNIGARHLLPMYAFLFVLAGGAVAALAGRGRPWAIACAALVLLHVGSSMAAMPNEMAYANEAWGGPHHVHALLSDANVDWAQQLIQVKQWQDRHPGDECWFAYFAYPEVEPSTYGIHCHALATIDTMWLNAADLNPPTVTGHVLISAGDLSGCEWPSGELNPYRGFQVMRPEESIDDGVFVYNGTFAMQDAAADARAQRSGALLQAHHPGDAMTLAREAVAIAPGNLFAQTALGDAAAALGDKAQARQAWQAAVGIAEQLAPDAQPSYIPGLRKKLAQL
ncbi:MAG TPA: phospholipid carrier-dependent glycosyltransferase [Acidobacteriaceae bacterium]|nr:phospholipid carrier-dependent glycosyltransferase [Acidobacteriaceae bacterium]